jgi:hypothetical protein
MSDASIAGHRQIFARAWHKALRLTRAAIFQEEDALRPVYRDPAGTPAQQIDIPNPGMVGPRFRDTLVIMAANPHGGRATYTSSPRNDALYAALRDMQATRWDSAEAFAAFNAVNTAFAASLQERSADWQATQEILDAARHALDEVVFLYAVPFRTKDDRGNRMPITYVEEAWYEYAYAMLDVIWPAAIVALDATAERIALQFRVKSFGMQMFRYPREKNADAQRQYVLAEIRKWSQKPYLPEDPLETGPLPTIG